LHGIETFEGEIENFVLNTFNNFKLVIAWFDPQISPSAGESGNRHLASDTMCPWIPHLPDDI